MAVIIDGKEIAAKVREELKEKVDAMVNSEKRRPCLAVILVGEDPASKIYVRNKQRACAEVGIAQELYTLAENVSQESLEYIIDSLAQRSEVSRATIYKFLDATPRHCLRICDINLRQHFYSKEVIRESLRRCNILKINDEELVAIGRMFGYPGLDFEHKCWLILGKYHLNCLVLTCGVNGSYVFSKGVMSYLTTPKVKVSDTVGAGDSFTGAFTSAILAGKSVHEAHELAVNVSAYVCTQNGAMPKLPSHLLDVLK